MEISNDIKIRLIKIIDIAFITCLYFFSGYVGARILDKFFDKFLGKLNKKKHSKQKIIFHILIQVSITGIVSYIGRNLIQMIPFPLDKLYGFNHLKVKEVTSGGLLTGFLVLFQSNLQEKIGFLKKNTDAGYIYGSQTLE